MKICFLAICLLAGSLLELASPSAPQRVVAARQALAQACARHYDYAHAQLPGVLAWLRAWGPFTQPAPSPAASAPYAPYAASPPPTDH